MLPSSTYAKTSALCRCDPTTSPGARTTVSIKPSFPGISGRCFVIRGVSFATCACTLLDASNGNGNSRNTNIILFIYQLPKKFLGCNAHQHRSLSQRGPASFTQKRQRPSFEGSPNNARDACWRAAHKKEKIVLIV